MSGEPDLPSDEDDVVEPSARSAPDGAVFSLGSELVRVNESGRRMKEEEDAVERGDAVSVTFTLPDGSSLEQSVRIWLLFLFCKML